VRPLIVKVALLLHSKDARAVQQGTSYTKGTILAMLSPLETGIIAKNALLTVASVELVDVLSALMENPQVQKKMELWNTRGVALEYFCRSFYLSCYL
jgi:hypothetical protein